MQAWRVADHAGDDPAWCHNAQARYNIPETTPEISPDTQRSPRSHKEEQVSSGETTSGFMALQQQGFAYTKDQARCPWSGLPPVNMLMSEGCAN